MLQLNILAFMIVVCFFTFGPAKFRLPLWAAVVLGIVPWLNLLLAVMIVVTAAGMVAHREKVVKEMTGEPLKKTQASATSDCPSCP